MVAPARSLRNPPPDGDGSGRVESDRERARARSSGPTTRSRVLIRRRLAPLFPTQVPLFAVTWITHSNRRMEPTYDSRRRRRVSSLVPSLPLNNASPAPKESAAPSGRAGWSRRPVGRLAPQALPTHGPRGAHAHRDRIVGA